VIRSIINFHQDDEDDWVAELSCLHNQHIRHHPPFQNHPWILKESERDAHLGSEIDCLLCDRAELPNQLSYLRTAGPWDEHTLPRGLQMAHRVAAGIWGRLRVLNGSVDFCIATTPPINITLAAGAEQAIPPSVLHEVALSGPVYLLVEFWGRHDG
jgi:tellurite resistance-related uncharacterized protein